MIFAGCVEYKNSTPETQPVTKQSSEAVSQKKRKTARDLKLSKGFSSQLFAGETGGFGTSQKLGSNQ